jgi:cytochrome c peroxidase
MPKWVLWNLAVVAMMVGMMGKALAFDFLQPLPAEVPIPHDNPETPAKIALGKQLFFDRRLSLTGTVSCNSCHDLTAGATDDRAVSVGALGKSGRRNAPTLWNTAFQTVQDWDGRARSLEEQLHGHFLDETVMAMPDAAAVERRLAAITGYHKEFAKAFGGDGTPRFDDAVRAIAAFVRTLVTPDSAFDRYIRGDKTALSAEAKQGLNRFRDIGCMSCHFGVNFAGPAPGPALKMGDGFYELFPNYLGTDYEKRYHLSDDLGRYDFSHNPGERHMFRLPTLRNIALTAPYFHNGSVASLSEAVRVMGRTELNQTLSDQDTADIVAFLETLTGRLPVLTLPRLPPTPPEVVWSWQRPETETATADMQLSSHQP